MEEPDPNIPFLPRTAAPPLLVAQLVLMAAGAIFLAITVAVLMGETQAADEWMILALRSHGDLGTAIGPAWLTEAVITITTLGNNLTLVASVLLGVAWFHFRGDRNALRMILLVGIGGLLIMLVLKLSVGRPRPDVAPWLATADPWSFPSGHAMMTMAIFVALAVLVGRGIQHRRIRNILILAAIALSIAAGLTRVFLGVHYPSDVLAGWVLGIAWLAACWLWEARGRRGRRGREAVEGVRP
jgi:undecaprenyl-diphosphatase